METDERKKEADFLLSSIQKKEQQAKKGNLKIYLGMVAGVGKTYAMLKNAHRLKQMGVDVVVGYVEPHGRMETETLLEGLEIIPIRKIEYKGIFLNELDIDAVIKRNPELVLVDELAHTNVAGSRHKKRYQDIQEILEHGINVDTTVNIQHVESIADNVTLMTGIPVYETIPDSILETTSDISLIDLSPQDLLERLNEGKIYPKEQARLARENFFKLDNLTALREMVLNVTSKIVNQDLQDYLKVEKIQGTWKAGEKILVAISPSPYSAHLLRYARKLAFNLKANWIAVYVEKQDALLSEEGNLALNSNLELAKELGAEIYITRDDDIVRGILNTARQNSVTQIIVGKPLEKKWISFFKGGSLIDDLIHKSKEISIHVVSPKIGAKKKIFPIFSKIKEKFNLKQYFLSFFSISVAALLFYQISHFIGYKITAIFFLLIVAILGLFIGRGPILFAAFLSGLLWNYLFLPPTFTLYIGNFEDFLMFAMYFVVAIVTGNLTSRLKSKERALLTREERLSILYNFARDIGNSFSVAAIVETIFKHFKEIFKSEISIILNLEEGISSPKVFSTYPVDDRELSVALWAIRNRQKAGKNTNTLPDSKAQYFPVFSNTKILGVLGIQFSSKIGLTAEQQTILPILMSQVGLALERNHLEELAQNTKVAIESEKLNKILLNSISHELRTPLTAIQSASNELSNPSVIGKKELVEALLFEINEASVKLNRIVENLLDMSRIESGIMRLNLELRDIDELIHDTINRLQKELSRFPLDISIEEEIPPIRFDYILIQQVLFNLLINITIHTPEKTRIKLMAGKQNSEIFLIIEDNGNGIPADEIERIFDKFYRGTKAGKGGTGLGLAICKGIIEAHKGRIKAENVSTGGARFEIRLPIN